jgi:peroxiredoxin
MSTLRGTGWAAATAVAWVLWPGSVLPHEAAAQTAEERPEVGFRAPDFTLPGLGGARVKLSDFRGKKAVFLNFWASWCPSCQEEMPTMETLYREFKPRGLEILAVSIDTRTGDVATFTKMHGVSFPALLDPDQRVFTQYRASKIPTHVLIDRHGVIRAREVGSKDWSRPEAWKAIEALLREGR